VLATAFYNCEERATYKVLFMRLPLPAGRLATKKCDLKITEVVARKQPKDSHF
jgi:hypothetical protein